jgi:class 3 adenylate cyclase
MKITELFHPRKTPLLLRKFSGEGTVLMASITDFSLFAGSATQEGLLMFLKRHIASQTRIIRDHSGIVLLYVGDWMMSYWRQIESRDHFVQTAFDTAIEMLSRADDAVDYRIVLGTGPLSGDFFGPEMQFQVHGDADIVADELSGFRLTAHRSILLTEATRSQLTNADGEFSKVGKLSNGTEVLCYRLGRRWLTGRSPIKSIRASKLTAPAEVISTLRR